MDSDSDSNSVKSEVSEVSVPFGGTLETRSGPHELAPLPQTFSDPNFFAGREPPPAELLYFPNSQQNLQQLPQGQPQWPYSMNFQAPAQMVYHDQVYEASAGPPPVELPLFQTSQQNLQLPQGQPQWPALMNFQAPAQTVYHGQVYEASASSLYHSMNLPPVQIWAPQAQVMQVDSNSLGREAMEEIPARHSAVRTYREETRTRSSSMRFNPYARQNPALVQPGSSSTPFQRSTAATGSRPSLLSTSVNPYAAPNLTPAQIQLLTPLERSILYMSRHPWPMGDQGVLTILYAGSSTPSMAATGSRQPVPSGDQSSSSSKPVTTNAEIEHIRVNRMPWEDEHQSLGRNCYLCERDLSYPPDGPIVDDQPLLPGAAVLPCGHAFHAVCLEKVTPEDRKDDPPCVLCRND